MRKFQKMLVASVLTLIPAAYASAQDYQQGGDQGGRQNRLNRQFGGQNGDQNGGQGFGGGNNRRQFNGNGQFGGDRNGGVGNNGNKGGNYGGNNGGGRQRSFDGGNSSLSTPSPVTKPDTSRAAFVPPVATGPFTFSVQQLPSEYSLLNNRSIFSKDHRATQTEKKVVVFEKAEVAALVLRGATQLDTGEKPFTAQIEDTNSSKSPTWVVEGQILTSSGARVVEITLDHIVVEKDGARRMITIGVNLDQGEKVPTPVGTASASPTGTAGDAGTAGTGASPVKIAASETGNTSEEDVAEMMRRRRQAQLGQ